MKPRYVIHERSPRRRAVRTALLLVLLLAAALVGSEYGRVDAAADISRTTAERDMLRQRVKTLATENAGLLERAAILERAAQVERQAYTHVDETLRDLQDQILDLKEELAFYRGIVTTSGKTRGLAIQSFKLESNGQDGEYRYKLVLTRAMKNDKVTRGLVSLTVSGEQEGSPRELTLSDLTGQGQAELKLHFRYFQRLEGQLALPQGFVPHRILVSVTTTGKKRSRVEKTFDWLRLAG
ncbi:MAG: hypothetical protein QNK18_13950 [Gammaproteobacteria bacterium]|nr:hypothetical protein [Gammaproteobacteria bacterium]